ncbi:hypothetical protein [Vibrio europaeus]|uniref:hypothetical protein n=1 Tax=Vibrio europaeus TaxID=300876 RepID=UPI0039E0FF40
MAKNSRELEAKHTLYSATTGGGKTTAIHKSDVLRKQNRIAIFDPYNAYKKLGRKPVIKTYSLKEFAVTLHKLMNQKKPFVVSLCGVYGKKELILFAEILWAVADGNKELHTVIEELAASVTPRAIDGRVGELWRGGRQFGLVMHALFQRPQDVPKVVTNLSRYKWIGKVDNSSEAEWWSKQIDVPVADIKSLKGWHYYFKETGKPAIYGKLQGARG